MIHSPQPNLCYKVGGCFLLPDSLNRPQASGKNSAALAVGSVSYNCAPGQIAAAVKVTWLLTEPAQGAAKQTSISPLVTEAVQALLWAAAAVQGAPGTAAEGAALLEALLAEAWQIPRLEDVQELVAPAAQGLDMVDDAAQKEADNRLVDQQEAQAGVVDPSELQLAGDESLEALASRGPAL